MNTKAIKIPLTNPIPLGPSGQIDTLYLEYRGMTGFDSRTACFRNISLNGGGTYTVTDTDGVLIRAADCTSNNYCMPYLLDMHPGSVDASYSPNIVANAYLFPGESFKVPLNDITIDVLSVVEGDSLTVELIMPPLNNDFSKATVLSGVKGTTNTNNIGATAETGEPNHGDGKSSAFASIWFNWTAAFSGQMIFNTYASTFDTTLAAYTGEAVNSLTKLAENNDASLYTQSLITFPVVAGTTYHVAVDGNNISESGTVVLNYYPFSGKSPWSSFFPAILRSTTTKSPKIDMKKN